MAAFLLACLSASEIANQLGAVLRGQIDLAAWSALTDVPDAEAVDERRVALSKLVALQLPVVGTHLANVVRLRSSETVFYEWRQALSSALDAVGDLEESLEWSDSARNIVAAELEPLQAKIRAEVKRSEPLANMFHGLEGVGIAAFGAAAGSAAAGNLAAGLISGSAAALGRAVVETIRSRKDLKSKRAVLELATIFES